jgi:3-deoxy-D-arabino-heptulosonate 7-phosphate (DAHP) synthase
MEGVTAGRRTDPAEPVRERRLLAPAAMRRALPASPEALAGVRAARDGLRALIQGRDRRRIAVIAGPDALHDPEGALDYARRLQRLAAAHSGELVVAMRCCVGRPSRGAWPGLVHDPERNGSGDVGLGLATARQLLCRIAALPLACALDLHDAWIAPYVEDLVACGMEGATAVVAGDAPGHAAARAPLPGVMLRSYLEPGRQDALPGRRLSYGVAVGEACAGWPETADRLGEIADAVKRSR